MVANRVKKSRTAEEVDQFLRDDVLLAIEKLQEVQDELDKVNEEADKKILEIEQKYNEIREPVYIRRNEIINSIPEFWLTAFLNHPALGNLLTEEDQQILRYLDSLHVEDYKDPKKGYCITFNFKENPYFENTKLTKAIEYSDDGTLTTTGSGIKWKEGKGPADGNNAERNGNKRPLPSESFFSWFSYPSEAMVEVDQDVVADLIKEEIWPNPIEHLNLEVDEDSEEDEDDDDEDDVNNLCILLFNEGDEVDEEDGSGNDI